jgi:hypothetical protein
LRQLKTSKAGKINADVSHTWIFQTMSKNRTLGRQTDRQTDKTDRQI